jgi:hypothetical protein
MRHCVKNVGQTVSKFSKQELLNELVGLGETPNFLLGESGQYEMVLNSKMKLGMKLRHNVP